MENPRKEAYELGWFKWTVKNHKLEFFGVLLFIIALAVFQLIHLLPMGIIFSIIMIPAWLIRAYLLHRKNYRLYFRWEEMYNKSKEDEL